MKGQVTVRHWRHARAQAGSLCGAGRRRAARRKNSRLASSRPRPHSPFFLFVRPPPSDTCASPAPRPSPSPGGPSPLPPSDPPAPHAGPRPRAAAHLRLHRPPPNQRPTRRPRPRRGPLFCPTCSRLRCGVGRGPVSAHVWRGAEWKGARSVGWAHAEETRGRGALSPSSRPSTCCSSPLPIHTVPGRRARPLLHRARRAHRPGSE